MAGARSGTELQARQALKSLAALILFAAAYAIINYQLLVVSILYRAAANDYESAAAAAAALSIQAAALLAATVLLPRYLFYVLLALVAVSAFVNVTYADILDDTLDVGKMAWVFAESRQASEATGLFAVPAAIAAAKTLLAILLLIAVRSMLRPFVLRLAERAKLSGPRLVALLAILIVLPFLLGFGPTAAERNVYAYTARILTAPPPPARDPVAVEPDPARQVEKIVWLVDESITHEAFSKLLLPRLQKQGVIDFGEAAALGNCSSPANVALRSGIDVRRIAASTDLRRNPTIWGYARKAGFRTMLVEGQVSGPPQNMIIGTERALIDDYVAAEAGLRTDYRIARMLNRHLRAPGKQFIYAILRGVHFQYSDHYPDGILPDGGPIHAEYETAVAYSKKDMFEALLAGVDRSKVAIVYTSDHGQTVRDGAVPHCSNRAVRSEFLVPLAALLPSELAEGFAAGAKGGRSASQIFPTTLQWMGYDRAYAENRYDRDLRKPTARYVWLGRKALPTRPGEPIEVNAGPEFPGR